MSKFPRYQKFSKEEQQELLILLCQAISNLKNSKEAAEFLKDLLSRQEAGMLARRLKAAELLIGGLTFGDISRELKMSSSTIAKINEWLNLSGEGFRLVLQRIPKKEERKTVEEDYDPFSWRNVKKRYPAYFWPQLLLEAVVTSAKERDKEKIRNALGKMDKKTALYKKIDRLISENNKIKRK